MHRMKWLILGLSLFFVCACSDSTEEEDENAFGFESQTFNSAPQSMSCSINRTNFDLRCGFETGVEIRISGGQPPYEVDSSIIVYDRDPQSILAGDLQFIPYTYDIFESLDPPMNSFLMFFSFVLSTEMRSECALSDSEYRDLEEKPDGITEEVSVVDRNGQTTTCEFSYNLKGRHP